MTFYQQARRLVGLRVYVIIGVVIIGAAMAAVGDDVMRRFINTCDEPPTYHADVPPEVRDTLDSLHEQDLLFCSDPLKGLQNMDDRVYWATDGVSSVLFFQADDLSDLGVVRYGFGQSASDAYVPVTTGAAPIPGLREDTVGRPALTNQAPEGATYFSRVQGAPADDDNVVAVTIRGTALPQPGITGRDAFRDLEMAWNQLRGGTDEVSDTRAPVNMPILSSMWADATRRVVNPDLAGDEGRASAGALRDAELSEPTIMQTVSGPLGTTVWVAGVISGTHPALVLVPLGETTGDTWQPIADSTWIATLSDDHLAHFAFPPLDAGAAFQARFWHEARDAASEPPDFVWPVTVP